VGEGRNVRRLLLDPPSTGGSNQSTITSSERSSGKSKEKEVKKARRSLKELQCKCSTLVFGHLWLVPDGAQVT
jgi:hypothetical protein